MSDGHKPTPKQNRVRFSFVSADLGDQDEDMIAIPRWALSLLAEIAEMHTGCDARDEAFEPGCPQCEAIRTARWASECARRIEL